MNVPGRLLPRISGPGCAVQVGEQSLGAEFMIRRTAFIIALVITG